MPSEQFTSFGKRPVQSVDAWSQGIISTSDRSEAKEVLGSLAKIGEEINTEIMRVSVATMNGIAVDRTRRDDLLVLSKKYDALLQALYIGDEKTAQLLLPKFLELLSRITQF